MTRENGTSVRLSPRDWIGMVGGGLGIIATIFGSYQSLTRDLVEVRSMQGAVIERVESLERDIERLEGRIFDGP